MYTIPTTYGTRVRRLKKSKAKPTWKTLIQFSSLHEVFYPFYSAIRLLVLFPYSIPKNLDAPQMGLRKFTIATTITAYLVLMSSEIYFIFCRTDLIRTSTSSIINIGNLVAIANSMAIQVFHGPFRTYFLRNKWLKIMKNYDEIDRSLMENGVKIDFKQHAIYAYLFMVTSVLIFGMVLLFDEVPKVAGESFSFYSLISKAFGMSGAHIILHIHNINLVLLYVRVRWLNQCLNGLLPSSTTDDLDVRLVIPIDARHTIRKLNQIYGKMDESMKLLNSVSSNNVLIVFALTFIYTIFTIFGLYLLIFKNNTEEHEFYNVIATCIWDLLLCINSFFVVLLSNAIKVEAQATGLTVNDYTIRIENDEALTETLLDFGQKVRHNLPIGRCLLFPFDWPLVYSMLAASCSYFILLVQFDGSTIRETGTPEISN